MALLLYLDQNYLSGIVKRKPGFRELEPVLRAAVARGAVIVPESEAHRLESAVRPDLPLLERLRAISGGALLDAERTTPVIECERALAETLAHHYRDRPRRPSDRIDISAMALALPRCSLITSDALMADVIRRARLDRRFGCELFGGRRADVERLRERLERLESPAR